MISKRASNDLEALPRERVQVLVVRHLERASNDEKQGLGTGPLMMRNKERASNDVNRASNDLGEGL